ncbi:ubiquinone biosynthesis accessory factor UbiJ [Sedimenticola selenatireducens]|uniref:Ubiquinone biosynthesis accessory factor UbiJ n=1 Tax=Sedimenticola selenatireducens TaxID=191960 RepID=A0A2N6CUC8_9GAMM|nr:SCP2 sterol-binding domain-containing protein [Sedimenticola selenatireducens]PLX60773.1 MAG: sterol-binding protein [Sedimenticola selenatireducens]
MSLSGVATAGLEQALNQYLNLDPAASAKMARLHGKVIAFELAGLGQTLYLIPGPSGVQIFSRCEDEPDCTLRGTPLALARMGNQKASSDQLFSGAVKISGDTELAHQFGKILGGMSIDWEAQLAHYTGSLVAGDVAGVFRNMSDRGRRALDSLELDLQELLQKELKILPERSEVEQFLDDVDELRDGIERLEARLALLESNKNKPHEESR